MGDRASGDATKGMWLGLSSACAASEERAHELPHHGPALKRRPDELHAGESATAFVKIHMGRGT